MRIDCDITIVGGGLNGGALALALAQSGHRVTLIDALKVNTRKNATFDGRAYALAIGSQRLLRAIGIWDDLADHAQPMLDIKVTDGRAGEGPLSPFFLHFDHAEIEEGPMGFMVEDRHLRRAILDAIIADKRIVHLTEKPVVGQSTDHLAQVDLQGGQTLRSHLIVGCDGRHSQIAERASIKRIGWDYDQTALVCAIKHDLSHNGVAHQFFIPSGPLAILPLRGNRSSIVWSEKSDIAADLMTQNDAGFMDHLRPRFGDFLGDISLEGQRYSYPLALSLAQSFIADRIALVGDAAHGVHPLAGQGLNAGLKDVAALTQVLKEARARGEDIGIMPVLQRYQQWRRFDTAGLAVTTDLTNRLFSNDNPLLRIGRGIGLGVVNAIPSLRRTMIREAAGLTGDLPELMR